MDIKKAFDKAVAAGLGAYIRRNGWGSKDRLVVDSVKGAGHVADNRASIPTGQDRLQELLAEDYQVFRANGKEIQ